MIFLLLWIIGLPFRLTHWIINQMLRAVVWSAISMDLSNNFTVFLKSSSKEIFELREERLLLESLMGDFDFYSSPCFLGNGRVDKSLEDYRSSVRSLEERARTAGLSPQAMWIIFYELKGFI